MDKKTKIIPLLLGVTILSFMVGAIIFAQVWTEPTVVPPGGNVPTPLNVGPVGQAKIGGLILNTGGPAGAAGAAPTGLVVQHGNVGIGTASPVHGRLVVDGGRLAVNPAGLTSYPPGWGDGIHTWDLYAEGTIGAGRHGALNAWMSRDGHAFFAGNVGIGTTAPAARLHVWDGDVILGRPQAIHGATHRQFILHGAWNNLYIAPRNDANTDWLWDRFVITSGGNVGIGTTAPAERLEVAGRVRLGAEPVHSMDAATKGFVVAQSGGRALFQIECHSCESGNGWTPALCTPGPCPAGWTDLGTHVVWTHVRNGLGCEWSLSDSWPFCGAPVSGGGWRCRIGTAMRTCLLP